MDVIVVAKLEGPADAVSRAYNIVGELGFRSSHQGVLLPPGTFIGTWAAPGTVVDIRSTLVFALTQTGATVVSLIVIEFISAAWFGAPASQLPSPAPIPTGLTNPSAPGQYAPTGLLPALGIPPSFRKP